MSKTTETNLTQQAEVITQKATHRKRWQKVVSGLCAITVFVTTYALILPAITAESQTFCGYQEEHTHGDACYERVLTCGYGEEATTAQTVVIDEYEIIGLNLKSQLNQGFRGLVLFLLTLKIADKAIHRRQYAQNRNLSAERGAASMCSASTRHTLPTYISFRRSTELSARVDLHRLPLRHSTHVPVARAA